LNHSSPSERFLKAKARERVKERKKKGRRYMKLKKR
jgi:hypothetical protein